MASNQAGAVTIDAREALCDGVCSVLAALPLGQREKPFQVLFIPTIACLQTMTKMADEYSSASSQGNSDKRLDSVLVRLADEIRILAVTAKTYQSASSESSDMQETNSEEPFLSVLRQAWSSISHVAEAFNANEVRCSLALSGFLLSWLFLTFLALRLA
jgi:hypothetical protein